MAREFYKNRCDTNFKESRPLKAKFPHLTFYSTVKDYIWESVTATFEMCPGQVNLLFFCIIVIILGLFYRLINSMFFRILSIEVLFRTKYPSEHFPFKYRKSLLVLLQNRVGLWVAYYYTLTQSDFMMFRWTSLSIISEKLKYTRPVTSNKSGSNFYLILLSKVNNNQYT